MKHVLMIAAAWVAPMQETRNAEVYVRPSHGQANSTITQTYAVELDPSLPAAAVGRTWLIPRWVMVGILSRETHSRLSDSDEVEYVDRRRGVDGERGPTQIMRDTFYEYAKPGERFWMVESDTQLALDVTERILLDHRKRLGTWEQAIRAYNKGRGGRHSQAAAQYYHDVRRLADK